MIHRQLRIVCDQCKTAITVNTGDELEAERMAEKLGWRCPILSYYGGSGHYCKNEYCQTKAREVEYQQTDGRR